MIDRKLLEWGRAVKARRPGGPPTLWYFTDERRFPDPIPAIRSLPPGLCGVVFRHDGCPSRAELGEAVSRLCRARRLALVVAGDPILANRLKAGVHLRNGVSVGSRRLLTPRAALLTSSAHDIVSCRRAVRRNARVIFLSPVFPTLSHEGAAALGPARWAQIARFAGTRAAALGGVTGAAARRLPRFCIGAGAIGALAR